jgi:hypothetical protein
MDPAAPAHLELRPPGATPAAIAAMAVAAAACAALCCGTDAADPARAVDLLS